LGNKGEMKNTQRVEFEARPPYKVVRAEYHTSADTTQSIVCVARGDGLEVTITTGGQTRTKKMPAFEYTLADALTADVWVRRRPRVGDSITCRELDLEDLKTSLVTNRLLATKASLVAGVRVVYHELDALNHKLNLHSLTRCDARGRMLSS